MARKNSLARKEKLIDGLALSLLLYGTAALARKGTAGTWSLVTGKKPPAEKSNVEVELKEAATWALVSGAVVGVARVFVRRFVARRNTPLDGRR